MRKLFVVLLFISFSVCLNAQNTAQPSQFKWDIKFVNFKTREFLPVSEIITMETKDVFLISIKPDEAAYCYIVSVMASGSVVVMNNNRLQGTAEKFFGPFLLSEPAGTEIIHVIMSKERQTSLENLIRVFNNDSKQQQNADNLVQEVIRLKNLATASGETEGEYIPLEEANGVKQYVTRFSNNNLYVRTITIYHNTILNIM